MLVGRVFLCFGSFCPFGEGSETCVCVCFVIFVNVCVCSLVCLCDYFVDGLSAGLSDSNYVS